MRYNMIRQYVEAAYRRQGLEVEDHEVEAERCISDLMIAAEQITTNSISQLKVRNRL